MQGIEERIASHYGALTETLRKAADYVLQNPVDVATRSLRAVSASSGVSPSTFSRLSKSLGFQSYEELRELSRASMGQMSFADKAQRLRSEGQGGGSTLQRQAGACIANIEMLTHGIDQQRLEAAVTALGKARRVLLFGALGSTGMVEYMTYLARYFAPNWFLAGRMGASLGADLATIGPEDVLFVVTKTPYVRRAVVAAKAFQARGAQVVLLTDHARCPALPHADHAFVVPSDSPQFFSSYAATLVLIESIIAMIIASSPHDMSRTIRAVEAGNDALGEYWTEE